MDDTAKRRWTNVLKTGLALALLAAVVAYVVRNAEVVRNLPRLSAAAWVAVLTITVAGTGISVLGVQSMLHAIGARTRYGEMFLLHNAAYLLNLLPAKAGTVLRATYLRTHHDVSFPRFGVFALALTLLTTFVTAAVGLVSLLAVYGVERFANRVFAALLAVCMVGTLLILLVPVPVPAWSGRVGRALRELLGSRRRLLRRPLGLLRPTGWLLAVYLLGALRLGVIYAGLGLHAHPGGLLLLGALGQISLLVNLTPGGLGVRELLVGSGAAVLGVPVEAGLLAALIERAVGLGWAVVVGMPSAAWVWRRQAR